MTYDEATAACSAAGWALARDDSEATPGNRLVVFTATSDDGTKIEQRCRTQVVEGSKWNEIDAARDERFALTIIVSEVRATAAEMAA